MFDCLSVVKIERYIVSIRSAMKLSVIHLKMNNGLANGLASCVYGFVSSFFIWIISLKVQLNNSLDEPEMTINSKMHTLIQTSDKIMSDMNQK